jgi:hypothetical protein
MVMCLMAKLGEVHNWMYEKMDTMNSLNVEIDYIKKNIMGVLLLKIKHYI